MDDGLATARLALSAGANTLTCVVIAFLLRDARRLLSVRIAIPLFVGTIGYSLLLLPSALGLPQSLLVVAAIVNAPTLALNWLLGRALLDDRFAMRRYEWAALLALTALMAWLFAPVAGIDLPGRGAVSVAVTALSFLVMAHIFALAVRGYSADLVTPRRKLRIGFIVFVLGTYLWVIIAEFSGLPGYVEAVSYDLSTLAINLAILFWLARLDAGRLFPDDAVSTPEGTGWTAREERAFAALTALMEDEEFYREPGLTIGRLADRLGLPEHQLRRLINRRAGYRNFPDFLNRYRIAEAKARLSDPGRGSEPILSIALDCGYTTLTTFNRAFRALTGETPSRFRSKHAPAAAPPQRKA